MKTNTLIFVALGLIMFTGSCGPQSASTTTTETKAKDPVVILEASVMASHDSSMAQMGTIMRSRKAIKRKLATIDSLLVLRKHDATLTTSRAEGNRIAAALNEADAEMMDWMHAYSGDTLTKLDQAKALDYLNAEKGKIDRVRELMKSSIDRAQQYIR